MSLKKSKPILQAIIGFFVILTVVFLLGCSSLPEVEQTENVSKVVDLSTRKGALVDEVVFTQESDLGKVAGMIDSGKYHLYGQGVTNTTVYHRLRDSKGAGYEIAYGSCTELTLNPVGPEFTNGELNPFSVPRIREEMNRLINRRYIAEELYGGLAVPRFFALNTSFPDYASLSDTAKRLESIYAHAPEQAKRAITTEMQKLGAVKEKGIWKYKGKPVILKFLIRSDDTRKQIGDYVANLFEDLGFNVSRQYRNPEEGARVWFGGDPASGQWHLYTGGWISTIINRDETQNFSFYYTKRGRSAPLWQAYNPSAEFDAVAEKLERRDYTTLQQRQELTAEALELSMRDSVRIWLTDQTNIFPRAKNITVAADLAGGITGSRLWPYTIGFKNKIGGRVIFAAPSLMVEPWNHVAGSNWVFDSMVYRALEDTPLLPDPYTGLYHPQRVKTAEVTVTEGLPVTKTLDWLQVKDQVEIKVPEDSWISWNYEEERFITVQEMYPDGLIARSRTIIEFEADFFTRRFHDGTKVSPADFILPWILTFVRAEEKSRLFDASYTSSFEVFKQHFKGLRILSMNPLVLEAYSDQIFPDAESVVAQRVPDIIPWHILAIGIKAEESGELAFSSNKADKAQIDWMNLISGPSLKILDRHLDQAQKQSFIPFQKVLKTLLSPDEVSERYAALKKWYQERGHFWVSDGPFYLHSVHPVERTLVLRRYEDFPDTADKWQRFSRAEIPEAVLDGPITVAIGESAEFTLTVTFKGKPYPVNDLERVQFLLFDGVGKLKTKGNAVFSGQAEWKINFDADTVNNLGTGANSLEVTVISKRVALPTSVSHAFATVAEGTPIMEEI